MTRGKRGLQGKTGAAGQRGATGETGPPGPAGPKMKRAEVLAMVEDQFLAIRKQLEMHLRRTGEIQVQVDRIHALLKRVANEQ